MWDTLFSPRHFILQFTRLCASLKKDRIHCRQYDIIKRSYKQRGNFMSSFFAKIIASVIAFLFMLFPNSGSLQYNYLVQTNSTDIAAPKIINAIKEKDVDALEALMCQNIKENVNNLPEEINKLMNSIDGEIINSSWKNVGNYDAKHGDDGAILQVLVDIYLTTTEGDFKLLLTWETANTFAKEEAGIRAVTLLIPHGSTLADIRATEGIGEWHD